MPSRNHNSSVRDHSRSGQKSETSFGMLLRSSPTTTLFGTRTRRVFTLILVWLIVREAALRTNGFEDGPTLCPVRILTGYPCPGCGGTRAMGSIALGQFDQAWSFNPLAFLFVIASFAWAARLTYLDRLMKQVSNSFRSKSASIQVISLTALYALAWVAAINRFNSAIL